MHILNKQELKNVIGGPTLVEYGLSFGGLLADIVALANVLQEAGFDPEDTLNFAGFVVGASYNQGSEIDITRYGPGELIEDSKVLKAESDTQRWMLTKGGIIQIAI